MPRVQFTRNLQRFFPTLQEVEIEGDTVAQVIGRLDQRFPGIGDYIVDERGALRKHVNIFVGENPVRDRQTLEDPVEQEGVLLVMQALSGG
jgi:sulfur-carrier protein